MKRSMANLVTLAVGILLLGGPAQAQDSGFYAGLGIGQAKVKDFCDGATTCDNKDGSLKAFVGYQINKNFGAEFGYVNLGKASASGTVLGLPVSVNADVKAFELVGVGTIPFGNEFGAFAKLGLHRWDLDVSGVAAGIPASLSESGTDLTYGVGLQWNFHKQAAARVYWQRYNDIGDENTTGKTDVDVFGISVLFKF